MRESPAFQRLILFQPRPEFPLPAEWAERPWVPLGELRPLLQAISPVRDLSDLWRWVSLPMPGAKVEALLAGCKVGVQWEVAEDRGAEELPAEREAGVTVRATLVPAAATGTVERIELCDGGESLFGLPSAAAVETMLAVAMALRGVCGCIAVGL